MWLSENVDLGAIKPRENFQELEITVEKSINSKLDFQKSLLI